MKEYSDNALKKVIELSEKWQVEFENDNRFTDLPGDQCEQASFITDIFAEMMYNYHLQEPTAWTASALEEVICDLFPRKISDGDDFYAAVEPVLTSYFEFLTEKNYIGNGDILAKRLAKVAPLMRKSASDPSSWSFAKQLVMSGKNQGIDFQDDSAVDRFIQNYNDSLNLQRTSPKVGRNEPCPCGSGKKYKTCCDKNCG